MIIASRLIAILILPCASANAGLIAYWTGNGNALDSSGNNHDGAVNGAGYGPGVIGQAFQFDGIDDYVEIPGAASLEPTTISVAMWVNATSTGKIQLLADTSHGLGSNNNGWALQIQTDNRASFAYGNGSSFPEVYSSSIVADGTFHHVVGTLDGSDLRMYVDGVFESSVAYTGTPGDSTANGGNVRLGDHYHSTVSRPVNGLIDEVRIYDHALSLSEVQSLAGVAVPEANSLAVLCLTGIGLLWTRRRRIQNAN
ncbi:MAG: hypothetical protein Fues2KO_01850 [Fuerstiella sp.]